MDTPQGTSLEGTAEIARDLVKELRGQEGVARLAYLAGADRYNHFHVCLLPAARRRAKRLAGQTSSAASGTSQRSIPGMPPIVTPRNPLGGGGGGAAVAAAVDSGEPAGARHQRRSTTTHRQLLAKAQQTPEPRRRADRLQQRQPRSAGRRRPCARGRPRRAHGDRRRHAAADGVGRR